MKIYIISLLLVFGLSCWASAAFAQPTPSALAEVGNDNYLEMLSIATEKSPGMAAIKTQFTTDSLSLRRGLNPDDPEVGLDYYFGRNSQAEISIEQAFDFPVVYAQRNKLSKLGINRSAQDSRQLSRTLLLEISDLYLQQIKDQKLLSMLEQRVQRIQRLTTLTAASLKQGQSTLLELTQSQAMLATAQSELAQARAALTQGARMLTLLSDSTLTVNANTLYPQLDYKISADEFITKVMATAPETRAAELDSLVARRTLTLSRWEWAPKLKVGYKTVLQNNSAQHALIAGISIPLWQNRGNVKYSKALMASTAAQNNMAVQRLKSSLEQMYGLWAANAAAAQNFKQVMQNADMDKMLEISLQNGAITMLDALLTTESWWSTAQQALEAEYAKEQSTASLLIFGL